MGYTFGEPQLIKTSKYGWVVIFGSGYNNQDGKGYIFIVNPTTGAVLDKIKTESPDATPTNQAGLAHVQAFIPKPKDGTADAIYAGDLHGNLWRLDVTGTPSSYPAPLLMARLTDAADKPLPVTSKPLAVIHPKTGRRYVTVGTGRLLHASDSSNTQGQSYFAILDGVNGLFNQSKDLPKGVSFPFKRSNLQQQKDLTKPIKLDLGSEVGWYVDLGSLGSGPGWRVISDSTSFQGIVAFPAMAPKSDSACEPSGNSRIYAIDLGTGETVLKDKLAFNADLTGVVTDLRFYSVNGKARLLAGTDTAGVGSVRGNFNAPRGLVKRGWRQVQLSN